VRFDSEAFLFVFAAYFLVYSAVPRRPKRALLVVGSVAFYATFSIRHVPVLLALGLFTFAVTSRLHRETSEARRKLLLGLGVGANLLTLVFFKGAGAAIQAGSSALSALGLPHPTHWVSIVVPLGTSFYTLQAISYVVDVHRGLYEPPRSLTSFLASFTLFPHLLSGPIVRSSFLVPQIERVESARWASVKRAVALFVVGLVKKSIADRLAPVADDAFDAAHAISPFEAWTGLLAYAGQLYGDFSGYTDMATALALFLGLELPRNFDLPYLATSPADFWRRWHISLSTWLRDYVYLPLGVRFRKRRYVNIVVTWILAGLWHGVSSLFLLYGLYHGILLAATDWLSRRFPSDGPTRGLRRVAQTVLTFYLVLIGYVLFRARSVAAAVHFIAGLHTPGVPSTFSHDALERAAACVAALVFCHGLDYGVHQRRALVERPWILWPVSIVLLTGLSLFGTSAQPFIYFAF
jgi:D-alanyl-lipoteichoic acid acyltransferase DltB (MBOAT superfamily)